MQKLPDWIDESKLIPDLVISANTAPFWYYDKFKDSVSSDSLAIHELGFRKLNEDDFNSELVWQGLSCNKYATEVHRNNVTRLNWYIISKQLWARELILNNLNMVIWKELSSSPDLFDILEQYPNNIDFTGLSFNSHPKAIALLEKNIDKIAWWSLVQNTGALHIIERNLHMLDETSWYCLCMNRNPKVVKILKDNLHRVDWNIASSNPALIELLEENQNKIIWHWLSRNPAAMHLLGQNPMNVDYVQLSQNKSLFEYDYKRMWRNNMQAYEELMKLFWKPENLFGNNSPEDYTEMYKEN